MHSQMVYRDFLDRLVEPGTRWLDVGCGDALLPGWMRNSVSFQKTLIDRCEVVCGCDPVDARPHQADVQKYVGPCEVLPYADQQFSLVTANMVVEHVEDPARFCAQISRVMTPRGRFLLHTPNLMYLPILVASVLPSALVRAVARHTDGREDEEIFRTHYRMNTRHALQTLPGFRVVEIRCVETAPVLERLPIANLVESLVIRAGRWKRLEDLRADWIVVLEKNDAQAMERRGEMERAA